MREIGIPAATQNATRMFRNRARKMNTSRMPWAPLRSSRSMRSSTMAERSPQMARRTPGGRSPDLRCTYCLAMTRDADDVLGAGAHDAGDGGGLAVETGLDVGVLETVDHPGHLPQPHRRPARQGDQRQGLQLDPGVALTLGAHEDLALAGLDGAAGQIDAAAAHGRDHLVEGNAVTPEVLLGNRNRDLVVPHPDQVHPGDRVRGLESQEGDDRIEQPLPSTGPRRGRGLGVEQVVADLLGDPAQGVLRDIAVDRHRDGRVLLEDFHHQRLFGLDRKGVDAVDLGLDLVEHLLKVGTGLQLHQHGARTLARGGDHAGDPLDALDFLLDLDADALFDLLGGRPGIHHADVDHVEREPGEHLTVHLDHRQKAGHQDEDQDQVDRDVVVDGPARDGFHG